MKLYIILSSHWQYPLYSAVKGFTNHLHRNEVSDLLSALQSKSCYMVYYEQHVAACKSELDSCGAQ